MVLKKCEKRCAMCNIMQYNTIQYNIIKNAIQSAVSGIAKINCKPWKPTGHEKENETFRWFTETFLCCWFLLSVGMEVERTERCSGSSSEKLTHSVYLVHLTVTGQVSSYSKQLDSSSSASCSTMKKLTIIFRNTCVLIQRLTVAID